MAEDLHQTNNNSTKLEIVIFPWLAMGHLIPFLHLSKLLAQKGHRIHFVSTPRNLSRLPKIPLHLSPQITLIPFPFPFPSPSVPNLPPGAESSMDVPYNHQQLLKQAFDSLRPPLTDLLRTLNPDWVIYDYASHWLPSAAAEVASTGGRRRISCAFFSLFTAATLSFIGALEVADSRRRAEDFTVAPDWVPFESDVAYRLHEIEKYVDKTEEDSSGPSDQVRFCVAMEESDVSIVRSSPEFEPEWFDLLNQIHEKTILPIGFLPPVADEDEVPNDAVWGKIKEWLDEQRVNSVVYVALGSEVSLGQEEVTELALGLEKSGLPFFWALRRYPAGSTRDAREMLPDGFEERVEGRGVVYTEWAPQVKILSHDSVGGFLTHCGCNSVVEGLAFGKVLILFPVINDQGLNARLLAGKKLGMEVPRRDGDGSFTSDSVAATVRAAMVDESGGPWRSAVKAAKGLFGDKERNDRLVEKLVNYLEDKRSFL